MYNGAETTPFLGIGIVLNQNAFIVIKKKANFREIFHTSLLNLHLWNAAKAVLAISIAAPFCILVKIVQLS
jgi:hypothetical protein